MSLEKAIKEGLDRLHQNEQTRRAPPREGPNTGCSYRPFATRALVFGTATGRAAALGKTRDGTATKRKVPPAAKRARVGGQIVVPDRAKSTSPDDESPPLPDGEANAANEVQVVANRGQNGASSNAREDIAQLVVGGLQSDNPHVVIKTTRDLFLMLRSEEGSKSFVMLGGHSQLITLMKKWQNNRDIQRNICVCLGDMIHYHDTESLSNRKLELISSIRLLGGIELVVQALSRFSSCVLVQQSGIIAMFNLILCDNMEDVMEKLVHELKGVTLIAKAMKAFPKEVVIQTRGCQILDCMCKVGLEKAPVMKAEAVAAVAAAIQSFPNNTQINDDARSFMTAVLQ